MGPRGDAAHEAFSNVLWPTPFIDHMNDLAVGQEFGSGLKKSDVKTGSTSSAPAYRARPGFLSDPGFPITRAPNFWPSEQKQALRPAPAWTKRSLALERESCDQVMRGHGLQHRRCG